MSRRTIWQRLGFRQVRCDAFIDDDDIGFAPGYMLLETAVHVDWKDRLRILVSGKIIVSQSMRTDVHVVARKTAAVFSVLPPSYEIPGEPPRQRVLSRIWRSWRYARMRRLPDVRDPTQNRSL